MDPKLLLVFGTVVRAGSLGAAARQLGRTQPAISQQVRALERLARQPLVVRGARGIVPTEAGRLLLAHADAVAARLRAADAELAALADARSGVVRLATFPTAGATIVARALAVMAREHPGVEVRLSDAEPPEAFDMLAAGTVDAAVVFRYDDQPDEIAPPLVEHPLRRDDTLLILPGDHPLATRRLLRLADAAGERWVCGCVRCRDHLLRSCARAGFVPDIRHSTDDYMIVQSLVATGFAVAFLPRAALEVVTLPGIEVRRVEGAGHRRIGLVHHTDAAAIPALRTLRSVLEAVSAPVPDPDPDPVELDLERTPGC
ncbi:MAG: LysR family transcriptional regulator [Actinomycetota bacterium]|nr:LysR family transcriptional regulator [Actinomycetota bacterium]